MKDQVLKLCRRLKSCTLADLVQFTESEEVVIETIVLFLKQEGLIQENDGVITIADSQTIKKDVCNKNLNLMFQHRSDEEIEILLKGFCLEIPTHKLCHFINTQYQCVGDYYCLFRKLIYDRQFKELLHRFFEKPQVGRYRIFYEKYAYFYIYNNQVFVSDKLLRATLEKITQKKKSENLKKCIATFQE